MRSFLLASAALCLSSVFAGCDTPPADTKPVTPPTVSPAPAEPKKDAMEPSTTTPPTEPKKDTEAPK